MNFTSIPKPEILDVKLRFLCKESKDYTGTNYGFTIRGSDQIYSFLKLGSEFEIKIKKAVKFEDNLEKAYEIISTYKKNYKMKTLT